MWNRTENQIELVLIRHGETKANSERRYLGRTEEGLSEEGLAALRACKRQKYYPDIAYLFSSPMKRCLETAAVLYPNLVPSVIPEWKEMDFGRFEYKNYQELKQDAAYRKWIESNGTAAFPGGESREVFCRRCEMGLQRMCRELRQETEGPKGMAARVGAVVHGGTIMALLGGHSGNRYFDFQVSNGRGYLCRAEIHGGRVQILEAETL